MTAANATLIPIFVLTGLPGSGKTTCLNQWLQQPALKRTLVIQMHHGRSVLDHPLLAHCREAASVVDPPACPCCAVRQDLVRVLCDATWRFARGAIRMFDRVIIETNGLSDPATILHLLRTHALLVHRYHLAGVWCTVDMCDAAGVESPSAAARCQIRLATQLLLTQTTHVPAATLAARRALLAQINPRAEQYDAANGLAVFQVCSARPASDDNGR